MKEFERKGGFDVYGPKSGSGGGGWGWIIGLGIFLVILAMA